MEAGDFSEELRSPQVVQPSSSKNFPVSNFYLSGVQEGR
jgi:hypothetical protein